MGTQIIPAAPAPVDPNAVPPPAPIYGFDPNMPPPTNVREGEQPNNHLNRTALLTSGEWTDEQARKIVASDFERAAAYRQTNHESRWQEAAEAYLAYCGTQKTWEGSKIPRSNMQVHLCFQQVEALIPQFVDALTGNDLDFDVEAAKACTTINQCHSVRSLMQYSLRSLGGSNTRFLGWRECVRRMGKGGLIFGNGISEWGWEGPYTVQEKKWMRQNFPEFAAMPHPLAPNISVMQPTGRTVSQVMPVMKNRLVNQFWLDPCSLMDYYQDPNTRGPNVQEGTFGIRRKLMTVEELSKMRGQDGFNIPDDARLLVLAKKKQWTQGDTTRQAIAQAVGENIQPLEDFSQDPRLAKVEVLRWFSKDRYVWLLGREDVARKGENQYGAIPFSNWTYVDVPDAFYGQSIPDIVRGDQKLAKALIDGRLDELNLILHPPFISKRGTFRTASQSKLRPGANWEADDPSKDIQRVEMGNVTQTAYIEVDSLENRVQKKTGVTDLASLGSPSSGGNSANRTATGVQAQTNASNTRVHYLVANFEDQTAGPLLEVIWQLTREFMDPQQLMEIVGADGQALLLDPVDLYNSDPRFVMKTAQRMKQRAGLQGGGLNTLLQFYLNPVVMEQNAEAGIALDMPSIDEVVCDTFNLRPTNFWKPMTQEQMQARQQRQQQPGMEKMQLQQQRLQSMSADAHERDETALAVAIATPIITALAKAGAFNKMVGLPADIEQAERELVASIEGGKFDAPRSAA